ncbi:hypothetical protein, partial [Mycoplasmoides alvi]|uniref:hypothetical protein n=1 Tax=Mycoplasmoides alvi TaxID=78580 RepID=UPI00051BF66D
MDHSNEFKKLTFVKVILLFISSILFIIGGIVISNISYLDRFAQNKISIQNNSSSSINKKMLNINSYIGDVTMIANNPSIQVYFDLVFPWKSEKVHINLDKSMIDKFRNNSNSKVYQRSLGGFEYFNIGISNSQTNWDVINSTAGKWFQFVNLIAHNKYIWEEGFSSKFNLMQKIIVEAISDPNFDIEKPFTLHFRQNGNGEFYKNLVCNKKGSNVFYPIKETIILPKDNSVNYEYMSLNDNPSNDDKNISIIEEIVTTSQDNKSKKQSFKSNNGIIFSLR